MGGINPFECPICFEFYSVINIPTTLPCGHSCCIIHAGNLSECFACRGNIGDIRALRPTYALRDGAILFFSLCNSIDIKTEIPNEEDLKPSAFSVTTTTDLSTHLVPSAPPMTLVHAEIPSHSVQSVAQKPSHNLKFHCPNVGCETSCRSQIKLERHMMSCKYPPPKPLLFPCPNHGCSTSCKNQAALENHLAVCRHRRAEPFKRGVFSRLFGWTSSNAPTISHPISPPSPPSATSVKRPVHPPQTYHMSRAPASKPPPKTLDRTSKNMSTNQTLKSCGHYCSPSSLAACCSCMDRRPMQPEGTYPRYVDGDGWRNIGLRREGYCPICK